MNVGEILQALTALSLEIGQYRRDCDLLTKQVAALTKEIDELKAAAPAAPAPAEG